MDLHDAIRAQVIARPDATLAELRCWLSETRNMSASDGLMHNTLARFDLTLKKSRSTPPGRILPTWPRRAPRGASANPA